jgi:bacterial/archaeal transporter family protein
MAWWLYAFGAALTAALTAIFVKMSVNELPPLAATALRTAVVVPFVFLAAAIEMAGREWRVGKINWWIFVLAGLMNALSWMFYTKAMTLGKTSLVSAIDKFSLPLVAVLAWLFLSEGLNAKQWVGIGFVTVGILLMIRQS